MNPNYATQPDLKTKKPVGGTGIESPQYKDGVAVLATTLTAPTTNPGTTLNGTASGENLSAKFKNPNVKQDVPPAAQNQYESTE